MKDTIIYKINYSETPFNIERISELLKGWLDENKIDIVITNFELMGEASIILDYSFNPRINITAVKALTEQFFTRLSIGYEIGEPQEQ